MSGGLWEVPGYLVDAPLGHGASSRVWRGRSATSLDPVALKRIELSGVDEFDAARAAAAVLARLDHPNLIRLHELLPSGDDAVLVLDLVAGGSLARLLEARGRLTAGEVVTALAPIASALAYVHDAGVVHGDVTAEHILLTDDGDAMLFELGVERMLGGRTSVRSTAAYIDPGVAAGFLPDPASDVFMIAAVAVHALTGSPLWPGDTPEAALLAALTADLTSLDDRMIAASVPEQMRIVLRRALSLEPRRRGTAADFALDLRLSEEPVAVELPVGVGLSPADFAEPTEQTKLISAEPTQTPVAVTTPGTRGGDHRRRRVSGSLRRSRRRLHVPRPHWHLPRPAWHQPRGRWSAVAIGIALLAVGAGVSWGVVASGEGTKHRAAASVSALPGNDQPGPVVDGAIESLQSPIVPSGVSADSGAASGPTLSAADVSTILTQLDALREGAYARRAPLLLTGVYVAGPLLDEDTASLDRIVPSGCGLAGVRTTYSKVTIVAQTGSQIQISAQAALASSVLFCNGVATARAPGSAASPLHITLVRSGSHYLISAVTG